MIEANPRRPSRRVRSGPRFLSASEAIGLIRSGDTVAIGGSGGGLVEPDLLLKTLGETYRETGEPAGLTLVHTTGIGDRQGGGMDHLAHPGLARRIIAGNWGMAPRMSEMVLDNQFEAYNFPQGVMSQLFREVAGGRPGLVTHVGLGTFCDPRLGGGKLNEVTTEDLVQVVEIAGQEWLFYPSINLDVCLIRGTTADEDGNISLEQEGARLEVLSIAQATRNCGGLVIAQVKQVAEGGSLDPRTVVVPGICVDVVVVHKEQRQLVTHDFNPAFSGSIKAALSHLDPLPLDQRKVVARRALAEIRDGDVVNLGVGIADGVASVAAEEGWSDRFTLTVEQGLVGGVPAGGVIFGVATNPVAILDQPYQFDFYDGGGLDIAFLGFAQVDVAGNTNVSKFGNRVVGTGGFVNISQNARTVVFCGTFSAGGLRAAPVDGALKLESEGRHRKFVENVEQITFSAEQARVRGQRVLYITERAVFELGENGLRLTEVAPGIDADRDVLDQIPGTIEVADEVVEMDAALFRDAPLGDSWRSAVIGDTASRTPVGRPIGSNAARRPDAADDAGKGSRTREAPVAQPTTNRTTTLRLPAADGTLSSHVVGERGPAFESREWSKGQAPTSRSIFAAGHVVANPMTEPKDRTTDAIDWDATLRFRRHVWDLGLGMAEAMDTAQRGQGVDWDIARRLIRESGAEASATGGRIVAGALTDQLEPGNTFELSEIIDAYLEQIAWIRDSNAVPVVMASRHLAASATSPEDYLTVYDAVLSQVDGPVMLHWLGEVFDPALRGYWGSVDLDKAEATVMQLIAAHADRITGIKLSLLDAQREVNLRRRLPEGVTLYTGDDFNYLELIRGDDQGHSDALLGVFDAIAVPARAAIARLDVGDCDGYTALLGPTVPLARHLFEAPTSAYKTGVVFLAWLNGHQDHFRMVSGAEVQRSVPHLARAFALADRAGALADPELAAYRMRHFLNLVGVDT